MAEEGGPSPVPRASPVNEITVARIRQARDTLVAEYTTVLDRVLLHLESKLAASSDAASGHAGQSSSDPLTSHEKDVLEICRSSESVLAAESLSGQLKSRRLEKTKLTRDQSILWQKMISERPYLADPEDEVNGEGQEVEDEEYRVERDPSPLPNVEPTLNSISMSTDFNPSTPNVQEPLNPSTSRKRSLSLSKTDLRDLVPKRAKAEPRPRFKHITNALREEIVRDHITSSRGQAATVSLWKERYPDLTITQSSLSRWIKNAENIQLANAPNGYASNRSHTKHRVNYPQIDEDTGNALLDLQEQGEEITSEMIKQKFSDICDEREVALENRPKFSSGWMESFRRRHHLPAPISSSSGRRRKSGRRGGAAGNDQGDAVDVDVDVDVQEGQDHLANPEMETDHPGDTYLSNVDGTLAHDSHQDLGFMAVTAAVDAVTMHDDGARTERLAELAQGHFQSVREQSIQDDRQHHRRMDGPSRLDHDLPYGAELVHTTIGDHADVSAHVDEASEAQQLIREVFEREEAERRGQEQQTEVEVDEGYNVDPTLTGTDLA